MAERDRYNWDRGREFDDRNRDYGREWDRRRNADERSVMSRGADEVRSWFGDDEARHRRDMDEQRHNRFSSRERDREFGPNSQHIRREHGWTGREHRPDSPWEWRNSPRTTYGDQRDFIGRSPGWDDRHYSPRGREWDDPGYSEGRWRGELTGSESPGGWPYETGRFAGKGPRSYQRSDDRVREDVNERLTADPRIDASDIDVRVQSGEVTLSGTVCDRRTRRLAEEIVEDLPGVRDVRMELKVDASRWGHSATYESDQSRARQEGIGHSDLQKRDEGTMINPRDTTKR